MDSCDCQLLAAVRFEARKELKLQLALVAAPAQEKDVEGRAGGGLVEGYELDHGGSKGLQDTPCLWADVQDEEQHVASHGNAQIDDTKVEISAADANPIVYDEAATPADTKYDVVVVTPVPSLEADVKGRGEEALEGNGEELKGFDILAEQTANAEAAAPGVPEG